MCVRIGVLTTSYVPSHYLGTESYRLLDIGENFSLRITKRLEELTEINNIKTDNVLGFSIPITPRNDAILKHYVLPNRRNATYTGLPVVVFTDAHTYTQNRLYVLSRGDSEYDCELRQYEEHWALQANKTKLNSIKYRDTHLELTETNINTINAMGGYVDDGEIIRFPIVNYGRFTDTRPSSSDPNKLNHIGVPDFRPLLCVLGVLQKGFCKIGWKFRSPILESDYGRRLITYLLSDTMGEDENSLDSRNLSLVYDSDTLVDWDTMNYAPLSFNATKDASGGWINPKYHTAGIYDIEGNVRLKIHPTTFIYKNPDDTYYIDVKICFDTPTQSYGLEPIELPVKIAELIVSYITGQDLILDFVVKKSDFQLDAGSSLYFTLNAHGDVITDTGTYTEVTIISANTHINLKCKHAIYDTGDTIEVEKLINKDYTLLDLMKGVTHLFNGKILTDYINKTVWLYPPYPLEIWDDESVEGYFKVTSESVDLVDTIQKDSEVINVDDIDRERYILYKFAGEGDDAVKSLNAPKENPYLSYKVDLGDNLKNEDTLTDDNPFFEATANKYYTDKNAPVQITMPFMVDGSPKDGQYELAFDIAPRILYWAGITNHIGTASGGLTYKQLTIFGTATSNIPTAYQWTDEYMGTLLDYSQPEYNVGYGEFTNKKRPTFTKKNLFMFFYQEWVRNFLNVLSVDVLLHLTQSLFNSISFRNIHKLNILGRDTFGIIHEIKDFQTCTTISTPVVFVPFSEVDPCSGELEIRDGGGGGSGTDTCIQNQPELEITKDGDCYEFTMGGTTNSTVSDVIFEWVYEGDTTWTEASSLCNPTNAFTVRMTVIYEDSCPDSVLTKNVNVCGYLPTITPTWDVDNQCFTLTIEGLPDGVLDTDNTTIEYSLDDGVTWTTYPDSCVNVVDPEALEVLVQATIVYLDDCDDTEIEISFVLPILYNCESTDADVSIGSDGRFVLEGHVYGSDAIDIVRFRYLTSSGDPETDYWHIWDGVHRISPSPLHYQRVIIFCNNNCPTYCTELKVWEP